MKKGFTLVELIAVIIILAVIASITYPTVSNSIKNSKEKAYNVQVESIVEAAHKWAVDNATNLSETDATRVHISDLISNGYITKTNNGKLYNPVDDTEMTGCVVINYSNEYNQYLYDYDSECIFDEIVGKYNVTKGVNVPQLTNGMTPIKWVDGLETITTEDDVNWYNYSNKLWANAKTTDGSYWVWIPRYAYKISTGWHTATAGAIDIIFLKNDTEENISNATIQTSSYSTTGTNTSNAYFLEPAFQNDTGNTKYGFWVAKFEASVSDITDACYTSESKDNCNKTTLTPKFIPNVYSWRYTSIGNQYTIAQNMTSNSTYGWSSSEADTHMMTNYEWGTVAYLTQSIYGKNSEVWKNNSNTFITGCAGDSVSASSYSGCQYAYNTSNGMNASTTGNITGIYDMSGGSFEFVAAYINNGSGSLSTYGSNILSSAINKNVYIKGESDNFATNYAANINMYGDATYETSSAGDGAYSWNHDDSYMPYSSFPWFVRGGSVSSGGIGSTNISNGNAGNNISFRLVVLSTQ